MGVQQIYHSGVSIALQCVRYFSNYI